jgi:hypothetical protein
VSSKRKRNSTNPGNHPGQDELVIVYPDPSCLDDEHAPVARSAAEAQAEAAERAERQAARENAREQQHFRDRQHLAMYGQTELERVKAQRAREDARTARIAELEDELAKLRGRGRDDMPAQRSSWADECDDLLRRHAELEADPVVRRARVAYHEREIARGGGAAAHRSHFCQNCIDNNVSDEESYLLHSDPEFAVPLAPPEQPRQETEADRRARAGRRVPMISR